jgi:hypothetical protein
MVRAGDVTGWRWWRVFRAGPEETLEDLERARDDAEQAVREDLGRLAPAVTVEIASASFAVAGDVAGSVVDAVSSASAAVAGDMAGDVVDAVSSASVAVAGDMAGDVVEAGGNLLETSDELVEAITEDLPGGGVVNQVWGVVLIPGRFGVKVATTVLRRGGSGD